MKHLYIVRLLLSIVLIIALHRHSTAQNFHLVKDINSLSDASPLNPNTPFYSDNYSKKGNQYAVMNGISYFTADHGIHGRGLWRSDGSTAGTYQVKDSINPVNIIVSNNKLFFLDAGLTNMWTSNGTEEGTFAFLDSVPLGHGYFSTSNLIDLNGTVFFTLYGHSADDQLWKTNGTLAGTVLVKDLYNTNPEKQFLSIANLTAVKNKIYFSADSYSPGSSSISRLWVSDGTGDGTHIISSAIADPKQMLAGSANSSDSSVYFTASAFPNANRLLYRTNGDSGNTAIANGFNGIVSDEYYYTNLMNIGGVIYFSGRLSASNTSNSLYKFDINKTNGIQPVKIFDQTNANQQASDVYKIINVNNTLFFSIYDASLNKSQLWKSDGSSSGSVLLKDNISCDYFLDGKQVLYFTAQDQSHGYELWKSDGTQTGTIMLKDIFPGRNSSNPNSLTYLGKKLLFSAQDGSNGIELWQSDGSVTGTSLLKDINQKATSSSSPQELKASDSLLVFSAYDGLLDYNYNKLWKSDGTKSGTVVINDTISEPHFNSRNYYVLKNTFCFFIGNSVSGKQGLYKINFATGVTDLVKDFSGTVVSLYDITATDSLVYFLIDNLTASRYELWRTDGTSANTYIIKNGFNSPNLVMLPVGNILFFLYPNDNSLWKTDGTIAGTAMLKTSIYSLYDAAVNKGILFFKVFDGSNYILWKSNGTTSGTVKVTDKIKNPSQFIFSNGELFCNAEGNKGKYANIGSALFKTDGTDTGTVLVKDIHPDVMYPDVSMGISANGFLYFYTSNTSTYALELWKSDGTANETKLVSSLGSNGGYVDKTVSCNGKICFALNDTLWESDGTQTGTHPVIDDIFANIALSTPHSLLTSIGNQLFFTAGNYQFGNELYAGTISKGLPTINFFSAANGNWNDPATWINNVVPPEGANIFIRHTVTGNVNTTCNAVNVEANGRLTVNSGIKITMLQ